MPPTLTGLGISVGLSRSQLINYRKDPEFQYAIWAARTKIEEYLEIAVLTIWSDREISTDEHIFIQKFNKKLGFSEDELEYSMVGVESFILNNSKKIFFLANQNNYQILSKSLQNRLVKMLTKNKSMIMQEITDRNNYTLL